MLKSQKNRISYFLISILFSLPVFGGEPDLRHFLFIGEPNAKAWQFLIDNPEDRKSQVEGALKHSKKFIEGDSTVKKQANSKMEGNLND